MRETHVPDKFQFELGYNLVEMMIVVALVAVLAGIAVPNFTPMLQSSRMTSHYNSLVGSLTLARSEAIKSASNVSVCAMGSEDACGTDWSNGWIVFTDDGAEGGVIEDGETIHRRVALDVPQLTVKTKVRSSANSTAATERFSVTFGPRGTTNWLGTGSLLLCDDRGSEGALLANIMLAGDIRKGRRNNNNDLVNSWGRTTRC